MSGLSERTQACSKAKFKLTLSRTATLISYTICYFLYIQGLTLEACLMRGL